jgi:hypothetical protein
MFEQGPLFDRLAAIGFGSQSAYWMASANAKTPLIKAALDQAQRKGDFARAGMAPVRRH